MAKEGIFGNAAANTAAANKVDGGVKSAKKVRRVYDHEMTERERWALQVVLKAKGACSALAISIQEGKAPSADVIARCSDLIRSAGEMMFSD